jgi:hypothetical protein
MLVDASTFVPVENVIESVVRTDGHPQLQVTRVHYLEYEEMPDSEQNDALLELAAHPGATVRSEGH